MKNKTKTSDILILFMKKRKAREDNRTRKTNKNNLPELFMSPRNGRITICNASIIERDKVTIPR